MSENNENNGVPSESAPASNPAPRDSDLKLAAKEERDTVKAYLIRDSTLKEGDKWYLINVKWWELWMNYVDFEEDGDKGNVARPRPGPIDNSPLADPKAELRKDIQENRDYQFLPRAAWKKLRIWYGGGPKFPRYVVSVGLTKKELRIELHPLVLAVRKIDGVRLVSTDEAEVMVARDATVKELRHHLARISFAPPHNLRVWLQSGSTNESLEGPLADDQVLNALELGETKKLVFEIRLNDGSWPKDGSTTPITQESTAAGSSYSYGGGSSTADTSESSSRGSGWSSMLGSWWNRDTHSTGQSLGPGLCGLSNLGNTCFMNSALQCLSHAIPLTDFLISGRFKDDINSSNPLGMKGQLAEQYSELLHLLWSRKYVTVTPSSFKHALGKFAPQFSGYQQQDSQELLAFLLDGLHEDLNRVKQKPYVESVESNSRPDEVVAAEAWEKHQMRNKSVIVDYFQGQFKSTVVCPECKKVSITFDPFMYLSVPLPVRTDRMVPITVVYSDPAKPNTKFAVCVPKHSSIAELKAKLGELAGVPAAELTLADIYQSRIWQLLAEDRPVGNIRDSDVTFAFQIVPLPAKPQPPAATPPADGAAADSTAAPAPAAELPATPPAEEVTYVPVLHRKEYLFAHPIIISYKGKRSCRQVATQIVTEALQRFSSGALQKLQEQSIDPRTLFLLRFADPQGYSCHVCREAGGYASSCDKCPLAIDSDEPFQVSSGDGDRVVVCEWTPDAQRLFEEPKPQPHASLAAFDADARRAIPLRECFDLFTRQEKLSAEDAWYCSNCKTHREATKKFDLWKLPEVLVIHLKRFQYSRMWRDKVDALVDFPLSGLDLSHWTVSQPAPPLYDLFAVSNHSGGLGGGHYTASVLGPDDGEWYACNDSNVRMMDKSHVVTEEAYLLFYKRRGSSSMIPPSLSSASEETPTNGTADGDSAAPTTTNLDQPE